MLAFMRNIMEARRRDDGASAVEYGLLIAAIAAVVVAIVFAIGTLVRGAFQKTCDELNTEPVAGATLEDCNDDGAPG